MKPAIRVENLSKRYRLGTRQAGDYRTLREAIVEKSSDVFRSIRDKIRQPVAGPGIAPAESPETFWALRDVNFEVHPGEIVGIIGRNGAGKSTLLKILSRITEPTTGRVEIRGRVGSLLEVGTGFHPELTGRENVYLNGSILGMSLREINSRFDEIVEFSGIERFLDTPVKRYSSGMYVRLAFAVAAHLEPEILIVDEVLAVGDSSFQKRCLDKMQRVGQAGRTVCFVSHNMSAITRLCERVVLLDDGRVICDGPAHRTVSAYIHSGLGTTAARSGPTCPGHPVTTSSGSGPSASSPKRARSPRPSTSADRSASRWSTTCSSRAPFWSQTSTSSTMKVFASSSWAT